MYRAECVALQRPRDKPERARVCGRRIKRACMLAASSQLQHLMSNHTELDNQLLVPCFASNSKVNVPDESMPETSSPAPLGVVVMVASH